MAAVIRQSRFLPAHAGTATAAGMTPATNLRNCAFAVQALLALSSANDY